MPGKDFCRVPFREAKLSDGYTWDGVVGFTLCHNWFPTANASSQEEPMSSSNFVRVRGGLASAASGVLLAAHILNLGGDPEYGTVLGSSLVLTAHVALVFSPS